MKRYETKVLNALLDKYESSLVYRGENKNRQRILYPVTQKTFPEYFDLSSMAYDELHEELLEMEARNLIWIHWKTKSGGHVLKDVELNLDSLEVIYRMLSRTSRSGVENRALNELLEFSGLRDGVTEHVVRWITERITACESVKRYIDIKKEGEIKHLLTALHVLVSNQKEMYVREFSILHFHDSKAFEKVEGKLLTLIRTFYEGAETGLEELEDEPLLNLFSIYKNPAYVMVKGVGELRLCQPVSEQGGEIDLARLSGGIGLHSLDLDQIEFVGKGIVKQVMTIENLTVFHRIQLPNTLFLYLGGYHTTVRRRFLLKVYETHPGAEYLHFGDMDCGGFKILEDLRRKTGIDFQPYQMDCETFARYEEYCRPLTQYDKGELKRMLADSRYEAHQDILKQMLESGKKLEQECVGNFY